ncbi:MAG: pyridoxamine 5'-phosphate oxidase family protein [Nocardioidaceae bacterium]
MSTETWFQGHLHELSTPECLELLASKGVGRVAYAGPDGIEVLPVNYRVHEGTVLLRTSPHSTLGRRLRLTTGAFEVDEIDEVTQSGWSVLVRGPVEPVDPDDLPPAGQRPEPWPTGQRTLHLRLTPHAITGRRLLPG